MSRNPRSLFFITNQPRADWLGGAGYTVLRTPNIDGIAKAAQSVRFENFHE